MNNKEAAILITKINRSMVLQFFGYWMKIQKYKNGMIKKLMESFDMDAAKLAGLSEFDVATLTVHTQFGDVDKQLDGINAKLGIDQCWEADYEEGGSSRVDVVSHREALAQTLHDQVEDINDADCSGPSCRTDFSRSTGNSTNNLEAMI
jgi:hypothetical protein